jgi:hypothetical protein
MRSRCTLGSSRVEAAAGLRTAGAARGTQGGLPQDGKLGCGLMGHQHVLRDGSSWQRPLAVSHFDMRLACRAIYSLPKNAAAQWQMPRAVHW